MMVVAAVVSVLASIAVPAYRSALRRAQTAACQIQLANLARGLTAYAMESRGWLPPGPVERSLWEGDPDRGTPYELYNHGRVKPELKLSSQNGWYGLGLTWKRGHVNQGQTYYCPSATTGGGVDYEQAWPRSFDGERDPSDGKSAVFSTYAYRGGMTSKAGTPLGPINALRTVGSTPILADNPCSMQMWHEGGYNVAFLDGRAQFFGFAAPIVTSGHLPTLWQAIQGP